MNMSDQNLNSARQIKLKHNRIILAFPGMGKTPLSNNNGKFKDVDFGTFRAGMGYAKENEARLLPIFRNYVAALDADWKGCTIMTNEPKLMKFIKFDHMYLPVPSDYEYNAKKMGVDIETIRKWVVDWYGLAKQLNVPVTFIGVGLDHYFKK